MKTTIIRIAALAALAAGLALSAVPAWAKDYTLGDLVITTPWTRATPAGAKVAGGFMKIHNKGKESDFLIGGASPVAGTVEIHEMKMDGGVMKMRELPQGLEIKAGQTVELRPGSYHVMFIGLKGQIKQGETIRSTLIFKKAGKIEVEYAAESMGAKGAGSHGSHSGH